MNDGLEPMERDADGVAVGDIDGDGKTVRAMILWLLLSATSKVPVVLLTVMPDAPLKRA